MYKKKQHVLSLFSPGFEKLTTGSGGKYVTKYQPTNSKGIV